MRIVILDGYTVNPGDLTWAPIEKLGQCEVFDRTEPELVFERSRDADLIVTSKVIFDPPLVEKLTRLQYIGVIATGYNVIDLEATRKRNIVVTNVPNYCTESVAQTVFAHILELCHRIGYHDRTVKEGKWSSAKDFCYWDFPQIELQGKKLGIIGCGHIGQRVARIAIQFGMSVCFYDVCERDLKDLNAERVDLDTLVSSCDVITLHCPLTPETEGMINTSLLKKMKKNAFLINTARGPLVRDGELAQALNQGIIAGAGLDVLTVEPPAADNPLLQAKNCHITPHIAWASQEARQRLIDLCADNIRAFLNGQPIHIVN